MYKVNVKSDGKNHSVVPGERYIFSKRNAKRTITLFLDYGCEVEVTKFLKCGSCWMWTDDHDLYGGINFGTF